MKINWNKEKYMQIIKQNKKVKIKQNKKMSKLIMKFDNQNNKVKIKKFNKKDFKLIIRLNK